MKGLKSGIPKEVEVKEVYDYPLGKCEDGSIVLPKKDGGEVRKSFMAATMRSNDCTVMSPWDHDVDEPVCFWTYL